MGERHEHSVVTVQQVEHMGSAMQGSTSKRCYA